MENTLITLIEEAGLTVSEVAAKTELTRAGIYKIAAHKCKPRPKTVRLLAQSIGCDQAEIWARSRA
jgi:DNA-binding XRE family transcriptional regulator